MSAKSLTAEWIEIFTEATSDVLESPYRFIVQVAICRTEVLDYLTNMYDEMSLVLPSDMLRHRLTDEARAANSALESLGLQHDNFTIPARWQDLEAWILSEGGPR